MSEGKLVCPKDEDPVELYLGGYAGVLYQCKTCDYIGPLVVEKYSKEAKELKGKNGYIKPNTGGHQMGLLRKIKEAFTGKDRKKEARDQLERASEQAKQKLEKTRKVASRPLTEVKGIGKATAQKLKKAGVKTSDQLAKANPRNLAEKSGVSAKRIKKFIKRAKE